MSKFRATFTPALEVSTEGYYSDIVGSYELAKTILESIASYTLYLNECAPMGDYTLFTNYGYIEQLIDGEWVELEEDET